MKPINRLKFPPVLVINSTYPQWHGELEEEDRSVGISKQSCPSAVIAGAPIYVFNEVHALGSGSSQCCAAAAAGYVSPGGRPRSRFLDFKDHLPRQFIPFTPDEERWNTEHAEEGQRYFLRAYGPIIEIPGRPGVGVIWFGKAKIGSNPENTKWIGTGVAEVDMTEDGPIVVRRCNGIIFPAGWPQWGRASTFIHKEWIYLYGTAETDEPDHPVYVARVEHRGQNYVGLRNYQFWIGTTFLYTKDFVKGSHGLEPVMRNRKSGTLIHTHAFGDVGWEGESDGLGQGAFLWIGCSGGDYRDNTAYVDFARSPTGPWKGIGWPLQLPHFDHTFELEGIDLELYAHSWVYDLARTGLLLISWNVACPDCRVEMATIKFERVGESNLPEEACLDAEHNNEVNQTFSSAAETSLAKHLDGRRAALEKLNGKTSLGRARKEVDFRLNLMDNEETPAWARKTLERDADENENDCRHPGWIEEEINDYRRQMAERYAKKLHEVNSAAHNRLFPHGMDERPGYTPDIPLLECALPVADHSQEMQQTRPPSSQASFAMTTSRGQQTLTYERSSPPLRPPPPPPTIAETPPSLDLTPPSYLLADEPREAARGCPVAQRAMEQKPSKLSFPPSRQEGAGIDTIFSGPTFCKMHEVGVGIPNRGFEDHRYVTKLGGDEEISPSTARSRTISGRPGRTSTSSFRSLFKSRHSTMANTKGKGKMRSS